jgi:hypothetical protein
MSLAGRLDTAIADEHIGLYENRMQNKGKNLFLKYFLDLGAYFLAA